MAVTIYSIDTIISDPGIRGGKPIIAGTGILVMDIIAWYKYAGQTAEELAVGFGLSLGEVHAVLAYYHQNKSQIDATMEAENQAVEHRMNDLVARGKAQRVE